MAAAIAGAPSQDQITSATQSQLQMSFAGATQIAKQYPQYASQITAAAKSAFLSGDDWAYLAGILAILAGAALVFFLFPRKREEEDLLARYHAEDTAPRPAAAAAAPP
jgi:hypothetical protein